MTEGKHHDCEYIEIAAEMVNKGLLVNAKGRADWRMNTDRVVFSVQIEDVPVGSHTTTSSAARYPGVFASRVTGWPANRKWSATSRYLYPQGPCWRLSERKK
jgi:hypothetical protein